MSEQASFGFVDFAVFSGSLIVSVIVGLYYAIKDRKKNSMENYYFGERKMSPIPVGLSIAVTFISAISLVSYPAEVYGYGNVIIWFVFVCFIPTIIACLFYIPLFIRLKVSSIFEYLERRFNHQIRKIASCITSFQMMLYMAMAIYTPALALSAVTPLDLNLTIILTSLLCTIYTSLGGMKAVVWTDALQTIIIVAGVIATTIKSLIVVGGFQNVWDALERGQRNNALNFDPDPTKRTTFFTIIFGCAISWSSPHQAVVQRWMSCGTVNKARLSHVIAGIPTCLVTLLCVFNGFVMYAYFEGCDPIESGKVDKPDQMMPYMVLEIFQDQPGIAGLFVAAAYSGTLSTVSSGINSISALIIEDLIKPFRPNLSQSLQVKISKVSVFLLGVLATLFALLVGYVDRTILQIGYTISGMLIGPLTGVFVLGMLLPWANAKGAIIAQIVGTAFIGWIAFGGLFHGKSANSSLPTSATECIALNSTTIYTTSQVTTTTLSTTSESSSLSTTLYSISFLYYSAISLVVTVSSGIIASFITGASKPSEADPELFVPILSNSVFPMKIRKFFRFGVPKRKPKQSFSEKPTEMKLISSKDEE